jgi:maltose alpha-D-glucosyltransferase/alpha-amylase
MDPLYGYESVNVEAQSRDPHSLLNWTRRILAVRREHNAFGRGTLRFLYPGNRKILAYLREYEDETILCVANVAHSPQAVELDLSEFTGRVPVELNNGSLFPPIGQLTYLLTLPPFGFYWFILAKEGDWPSWHTPAPEPMPEYQTFVLRDGLVDTLTKSSRSLFEREVLPPYLDKRRWFSGKNETLRDVKLVDIVQLPGTRRELYLCKVSANGRDGTTFWQLPLAIVWEDEPLPALPSQLALARVRRGRHVGFLTDAFALSEFARGALSALGSGMHIQLPAGEIRFEPLPQSAELLNLPDDAEINWITAEQSNSSLTVGETVMLKLFRRIHAGPHPEVEMGRYLTENGFTNSPPLAGEIVHLDAEGQRSSLAIAQGFVRNQGDAWAWIVDDLVRALDILSTAASAGSAEAEHMVDYETLAAIIGRRLAEMHGVLAQATENPDFAPARATQKDVADWHAHARALLTTALDIVSQHKWEHPEDNARALMLQGRRAELFDKLEDLAQSGEGALMCRIHGDFHLGQVLVVPGDAFIIDFEGEPGRPLAERRLKTSPLRDVAGLLRSFDYAAATVEKRKAAGSAPVADDLRDTLLKHFRSAVSKAFITAYSNVRDAHGDAFNERLVDLFMIEKSAYEIRYEAANRPNWLPIPLEGLVMLAARLLGLEDALD